MSDSNIKELDVKRFNAFIEHTRDPMIQYYAKEIKWYSNTDESILGVILYDFSDNDYNCVVLGRDEGGRFRAFENYCNFKVLDDAITWLKLTINNNSSHDSKIFPQGDSLKKGINLFDPIIPSVKQHPYFIGLNSDPAFIPAKELISEIMPHFIDIDGNFVEQFQSTGFDSRIWELYLNSYLIEEKLIIHRDHNAPDFIVENFNQRVAIEAVIVGRRENNPPTYLKKGLNIPKLDKIINETENAMPIKFGSPLYSKLNKKYWDLPHVRGCPLIFAIADFHDDMSMQWSSTALINYLYGFKHEHHYDNKKNLVITPIKIERHTNGKKEIPSGFFFQPDSEYVSAILFSSTGTVSKFNRLGKQAGFGTPDILMFRVGTCHDLNPNASVPKAFSYIVDTSCNESWAEGFSLFHNPNAINPVSEELFPSIAHHRFKAGQIISNIPDFHPYSSVTLNMRIADE